MSPTRPTARDGRMMVGRIQAMVYRHRWVRFLAAGAAALAVASALWGSPTDPAPSTIEITPPGPSGRLPPGTRGVPIPETSQVFAAQDRVDVHAVFDGTALVRGALIVEAGEDEVVVAVPSEQVDATVDALATGGVMLVLVPSAKPGGD